jgi:hypothetical protein
MNARDPGVMMPELGRTLIHEEGVALVREWIRQMEGSCEPEGPEPVKASGG